MKSKTTFHEISKALRCFFRLMMVPYHTWTNSKAKFARVMFEDIQSWRRWPNSRPPWKSKQVADARNKILAARHLWDYQGTSVNLLQKRSKLWKHPKTGFALCMIGSCMEIVDYQTYHQFYGGYSVGLIQQWSVEVKIMNLGSRPRVTPLDSDWWVVELPIQRNSTYGQSHSEVLNTAPRKLTHSHIS